MCKSGSDYITHFDTDKVETKFACELKGFDPANYMDKKNARRLDLFSQYALAAAKMAVEDSGLNPEICLMKKRKGPG